MSSVVYPLLAYPLLEKEMPAQVGDRVRSLQEFGTFLSASDLDWELAPTQVILLSKIDEAWDHHQHFSTLHFNQPFHPTQLRVTLSIEWRSDEHKPLESSLFYPLLPEICCEVNLASLQQSIRQLQQKWNSTYWRELRQVHGLVPETIALVIQQVPLFTASGQVIRWVQHRKVCQVLETQWQDGKASNLSEQQTLTLCKTVLALPDLWQKDYSLTWGLDSAQQFWILAIDPGETLLTLPQEALDPQVITQDVTRTSLIQPSGGIAQVLSPDFPRDHVIPFTDRTIAVVKELSPLAVPFLRSVQAIIVESPGWNSHGVILARELGIPVLVGIEDATKTIETGESLVLRGLTESPSVPLKTSSTASTHLLVNRSQFMGEDQWSDRLGLVRSEWLMLPEFSLDRTTFNALQFQQVLRSRLTSLLAAIDKNHATLYYRCFSAIEDSELIRSLELNIWQEFQEQAQREGRLRPSIQLILPFVQTLAQFDRWHQDLQARNLIPYVKPWIMAEVPSIVHLLPDYLAAGAMGVIIGLNDLTQWTLGTSRESNLFQQAMTVPDRAVIRSVQQIIHHSQQADRPCWLVLSHWNEAWAKIAIEAGVTGLMVERDTVALAAAAIDRWNTSKHSEAHVAKAQGIIET